MKPMKSATLCGLFIAAVLIEALMLPAQQDTAETRKPARFSHFKLSRRDLNAPVSPWNIFIQVFTVGDEYERTISCVVMKGMPVSKDSSEMQSQMEKQLIPYSYTWSTSASDGTVTRKWLAGFIRNRDGVYHTIVKLPSDELKRSSLSLYFEDIDGDGLRDDITFTIDMSDFDWRTSEGRVVQGISK